MARTSPFSARQSKGYPAPFTRTVGAVQSLRLRTRESSECQRQAVESLHPGKTPKTHCKRGHLYTDATTKRDGQGKRSCRICNNARRRAQHQPRPACPNGHLYTTTTTPGRHRRCVICHPTKAEQAA